MYLVVLWQLPVSVLYVPWCSLKAWLNLLFGCHLQTLSLEWCFNMFYHVPVGCHMYVLGFYFLYCFIFECINVLIVLNTDTVHQVVDLKAWFNVKGCVLCSVNVALSRCVIWMAPWRNRISSTTMKLRKSLVKPVTRQNISSCLVLPPEIVMHDAFNVIHWASVDICVVHDNLGWKNQTSHCNGFWRARCSWLENVDICLVYQPNN